LQECYSSVHCVNCWTIIWPLLHVQVISDLLKPEKVNLMIREDRRRGVFVDGLSEWVVRSPAEVYGLMMRGAQQVRPLLLGFGFVLLRGGGDVVLHVCLCLQMNCNAFGVCMQDHVCSRYGAVAERCIIWH
jgi:hypothetical protein